MTTWRKLPRVQELIKKDKDEYCKNKNRQGNVPHSHKQHITEVEEEETINEVYQYQDEDYNGNDNNGLDVLNFPINDYTEQEDQAYYDDNWLDLEYISEVTSTTTSLHAQARSNGHSYIVPGWAYYQ